VSERQLALTAVRAGNFAEAQTRIGAILQRCIELGPATCGPNTLAVLHRDLGIVLAKLNRHDDAVASFGRALTYNREIHLQSEFDSEAVKSAYAKARAQSAHVQICASPPLTESCSHRSSAGSTSACDSK
jgi:tetratricopeptide (TPR) repeat protein